MGFFNLANAGKGAVGGAIGGLAWSAIGGGIMEGDQSQLAGMGIGALVGGALYGSGALGRRLAGHQRAKAIIGKAKMAKQHGFSAGEKMGMLGLTAPTARQAKAANIFANRRGGNVMYYGAAAAANTAGLIGSTVLESNQPIR